MLGMGVAFVRPFSLALPSSVCHRPFNKDAMNNLFRFILLCLLAGVVMAVSAQPSRSLQLVEVFDAGQPQAVILKLYDQQADVICYVLTPERASRQQSEGGWLYDGNNVGAISCLKQRQYVIDVTPPAVIAPAPAAQESARPAAGVRSK